MLVPLVSVAILEGVLLRGALAADPAPAPTAGAPTAGGPTEGAPAEPAGTEGAPTEGAGAVEAVARGPVEVVEPRVWIGVGMIGSLGALGETGSPGGGGGVGVEAGARLGKQARRSVALVARVHESVLTDPLRSIGNVEVQVQYPAGTGPHALVGFSHNHEALAAEWLADPVGVSAGVADTLAHRTGFEIGAGWDLPPPYRETAFLARFRPTFNVTAHVFPDDKGPRVYAIAEMGLKFGVDATRPATAPASSPSG